MNYLRHLNNKKTVSFTTFFLIVIIFVVCLPMLLPYFHNGYFPTHDGEWAVVRLGDMYREVRDGQIPARFSGNLNFGYGYPLFNFAYPLPYYLGLPFLLLHLGLVMSIKFLFVGSVLVSLIGMYLLAQHLWESKLAGVIAGICYAYFPYRMVDLYVRGSLGETMASALFPFVLLSFLLIHKSKRKILPSMFAGLFVGLLILSHNIMAVLFFMLLVPFLFLLFLENRENGRWFIGTILYGFALAAFFWIPAMAEKHLISLSQFPIADRNLYFVTLQQLLTSPFGYGPPVGSQGFTYQIGWPQLIILILSSSFALHWGRKNNRLLIKHSAILLCFLTVIFICLLFSFSSVFWHLPMLSEINYPWTLLLLIGFLTSLLSGYLFTQRVWVKSIGVLCVILAVLLYLPWARPEYYVNRGDGFYLTNDATTTSSNELMPLWVKEKPTTRTTKVTILSEQGEIQLLQNTSNQIIFISQLPAPSLVQINTIYYPGWKIFVDSQPVAFSYANKQGVMQIALPEGTHRVVAVFSETIVRKMSNMISFLGILLFPLLFVFLMVQKRRRK